MHHLALCQTGSHQWILKRSDAQQPETWLYVDPKSPPGETSPTFAEQLHREYQVIVACGWLNFDDVVFLDFLSVASYPDLYLYLKSIWSALTSFQKIEEAFPGHSPKLLINTNHKPNNSNHPSYVAALIAEGVPTNAKVDFKG